MRVAIAGGHGKIAQALTRRLIARGDDVTSLIRNPDHGREIEALGARPVVCDLEQAADAEVAEALAGADAAVFAAGAGPGSGSARKLTMDRDGAIKFLNGAAASGVKRFLIVSSIGAENPPRDDDTFSVYLRAKADADAAVTASDREWTVLRPGALTDGDASGRVKISDEPFRGRVAREDVAAVLEALLVGGLAVGRVLYLNGGQDSIEQALAGY
jgi:nucleoside-diphosphate-sugar epimerase